MKYLSQSSGPVPPGDPVSSIFGKVNPPPNMAQFSNDPLSGLIKILNVGLNIVLIIASLYCLLNFLLAGYDYITSNGDTKKTAQANQRIANAIIGLVIVVLTPLLALLLGYIIFGNPTAILSPVIPTLGP